MHRLLESFHQIPPELLWAVLLLVAFATVLGMHRLFGPAGLFAYVSVAVIAGNLHVLKITQFSLLPDPIPLGTILFATTFLSTDILAEYHGPKIARRAVLVAFSSLILFNLFMFLALAFRPLSPEAGDLGAYGAQMQTHLQAVFLPSLGILAASLIAYIVSQFNDIWIFESLRRYTRGKHLWLRNNVSTAISALIDNLIFGLLAFRLFTSTPVEWNTLLFSYVLGTYGLRLAVSILDSPIIYLAKRGQSNFP